MSANNYPKGYVVNEKGKKNQKNGSQGWAGSSVEFASRRLSREEAEAFIEWYKSGSPDFEDALFKVIAATYKVSFKIDMDNSAQVCSFMMQDDRHPHHNVYLTSRSDDPIEAFFMCCFKVWIIYENKKIDTDSTLKNNWG